MRTFCQPFSKQRKPERANAKNQLRRNSDAKLLKELSRTHYRNLEASARPSWRMFPDSEKSGGLARTDALSEGNASHQWVLHRRRCVLDAKHFGVPQTRRRFVLIASRTRLIALPRPTHGAGLLPYTTVKEAIEHFPPLSAGNRSRIIPNHVAACLSELNLQRMANTPPDGGDRRTWNESLVLECHKGEYDGHSDVYGRMFWDRPAPALTSKCNSLSNGRYGHPEQNRAISLREAASLQTFPDSYVFHGLDQQIARQIGNAVPVVFASALGRAILAAPSKVISQRARDQKSIYGVARAASPKYDSNASRLKERKSGKRREEPRSRRGA